MWSIANGFGTLMRLIGLVAIYQRPNTSKAAAAHKVYPYLLGGIAIGIPRPVAETDLGSVREVLQKPRRDLAAWFAKWSGKYSKLTGWVEDNIDETLTFYRLPRQHHKHLKSTNMLERLNEEIRRRTQVVRICLPGRA